MVKRIKQWLLALLPAKVVEVERDPLPDEPIKPVHTRPRGRKSQRKKRRASDG